MTKQVRIRKIYQLLARFFRWDMGKVNDWLNFPNPLLGDIRPITMIELGREEKLLRFIETQLSENEYRTSDGTEISTCQGCWSMTKTIKGKCGKCKGEKTTFGAKEVSR